MVVDLCGEVAVMVARLWMVRWWPVGGWVGGWGENGCDGDEGMAT